MLNDIKLHGRLGRDPELKELQGKNGTFKKATFSIAVERDFGDECDWFFCSIIGKRAEVIAKWFKKGSEIIVSGRMESYKPQNDPDHTAWIVNVSNFDFAGSNSNNKEKSDGDVPDSFEEADGDVPF